ncbi:MAG: NAD(P)/FAD-dependent oxidoreductase, partial [Crocinitomicaceae bacterium]|nr:NAD(P)/FAD-dependent oxidoreductase [Crocinitomicaceae bacterium]
RKETLFEDVNFEGKVIIIGAGAAGLYAAYLLKSKGINFQILEASTNYGGRLGKLNGFADFPIDTGAQWLHGKNNILGDLITKSQTIINTDNSEEFFWFNNQIVSSLPKDINAIFTREENVPDISFKDYAIEEGYGNEYTNIVEGIAGDSGAAASRISAFGKVHEEENWVSGDDDYKFQETYFDLIDQQIASQVKDNLKLNTIVSKIDYSQSSIEITDTNNNVYSAGKIIITVPITILKSNSIQFIPAFTSEKKDAFSKIGMDAGMKVFLKFSSKFFDQNIIGGEICGAYADESIGKTGNDNVLLAFVMGKQAEYLTGLGSDLAITNALLQELDLMYNGQATASFLSSHIQNWTTNPFVQGAYSYSTVGMGNARQIAAQTIDKKLYFAGEAMNTNGHHQTVHGAVESGYNAVRNLLNDEKK